MDSTSEMDQLLEETRRRLRESDALFRVSQAFTLFLDLDELLQVMKSQPGATIIIAVVPARGAIAAT